MADDYIDYLECVEYGEHFTSTVTDLSGLSNLVDITALVAYVETAMGGVVTELDKQGVNRSGLRVDRREVEAKTTTARKTVQKFYNYLGSLDDDAGVDIEAFFEGGNLGALAALKPADVAQRVGEVIRGFSSNSSVPQGDKWKTRLETAQSELVSALGGKGSSAGTTIQGTAALVDARQQFLTAYNGVAKKLIGGVLTSLGRKDDLRLYFKDLQVNESGHANPVPTPSATPPATTP